MDFLLNPNVAYLILLAAILFGILAAATPGTGVLEISALLCFLLVGYEVYNLSIRWWALIVLLLSVVPFVIAIRSTRRDLFIGLSIFLLVIGSVFIFSSETAKFINPVIGLVASALMVFILWFVTRKTLDAIARKPTHDPDSLIGRTGEARSKIHNEGSIYIGGEMWSARSDTAIPAGSRVQVVRREGFILVVEKANQSNS